MCSGERCYPLLVLLGLLKMLVMLRSRIGTMTRNELAKRCPRSSRTFPTGEYHMIGSWMLLKHLFWVSTVLVTGLPSFSISTAHQTLHNDDDDEQ
jgi:hypothetical protein